VSKERRKLWKKLLRGFELGGESGKDVQKKLGKPARTLEEDKVVILEYPADAGSVLPGAAGKELAKFAKVQFILYDDQLLNVSYVEPAPAVARKAVREVLGEPDEVPEDEDDEDGEDGGTDIFEVDMESDPMLSFAAHYDEKENLEALSLCAEIEGDLEPTDDEE
jgi:hypothetical protein